MKNTATPRDSRAGELERAEQEDGARGGEVEPHHRQGSDAAQKVYRLKGGHTSKGGFQEIALPQILARLQQPDVGKTVFHDE